MKLTIIFFVLFRSHGPWAHGPWLLENAFSRSSNYRSYSHLNSPKSDPVKSFIESLILAIFNVFSEVKIKKSINKLLL